MRNQFSVVSSVLTEPDGADVYMQPYSATDNGWDHLGRTPLKGIRLPRGAFRVRLEKAGVEPQLLAGRNPGSLFNTLGGPPGFQPPPFVIALPAAGSSPGSVPVPGGAFPVGLTGFNSDDRLNLTRFQIDRHEVTDREFKAFMDRSGYKNEAHWAGLTFSRDGKTLSWQEATLAFVDATGRPGPAMWELGDHASGQADHPVGGVSWYEAVAYCRAAGKMLPTIFHWARAGLSTAEIGSPLAPAIIPMSNFASKGPAPVGQYRGLGPYGTYDMAGNVREWVWNETSNGRRWILGGGWSDPDYMFTVPNSLPPFDRSAQNGFRCATYADPAALPAALIAKVETYRRDHRTAKAVSNEVYEVFKRQYALVKAPLNVRVDARNTTNPDRIRETLSFDAAYASERVTAYLFLPRNVDPPYQLIVFFPGVGPFVGPVSSANFAPPAVDYFTKSGRAVVAPVFKGSFERWDDFLNLQGEAYLSYVSHPHVSLAARSGPDARRAFRAQGHRHQPSGVLRRQLRCLDRISSHRARGSDQGGDPGSGRIHVPRDAARGGRHQLPLARDDPGPDDGRPARLHLSARDLTEADVRSARHAGRTETPGCVRSRPRQFSESPGHQRSARVARPVSRTRQGAEGTGAVTAAVRVFMSSRGYCRKTPMTLAPAVHPVVHAL